MRLGSESRCRESYTALSAAATGPIRPQLNLKHKQASTPNTGNTHIHSIHYYSEVRVFLFDVVVSIPLSQVPAVGVCYTECQA